jgi:hypothetical protein
MSFSGVKGAGRLSAYPSNLLPPLELQKKDVLGKRRQVLLGPVD